MSSTGWPSSSRCLSLQSRSSFSNRAMRHTNRSHAIAYHASFATILQLCCAVLPFECHTALDCSVHEISGAPKFRKAGVTSVCLQDFADTLELKMRVPARQQQTLEPAKAETAQPSAELPAASKGGGGSKKGKQPKKGAGGGNKGKNTIREQATVANDAKLLQKHAASVATWIAEAQRTGTDATSIAALLRKCEANVVLSKVQDDAVQCKFYTALLAAQTEAAQAADAGQASKLSQQSLEVYSTVRHMRCRFLQTAGSGKPNGEQPACLRDMPEQLCKALRASSPLLHPVADLLAKELDVADTSAAEDSKTAAAAYAVQLEHAGAYLLRTTDSVEDSRVEFVPDKWQVRHWRSFALPAHAEWADTETETTCAR